METTPLIIQFDESLHILTNVKELLEKVSTFIETKCEKL